MSRIKILKTYKLLIDGKFERSESGRSFSTVSGNLCRASRKDVRNAMVAARGAFGGWSSRSAYNRGQILYRMAEMLEARRTQFVDERLTEGAKAAAAAAEIQASIDLLVHYAGWADKYAQVFSAVNPVSSAHFNFSVPEPTGVVVVVTPASKTPFLDFIGMLAPVIVSGNTAVVLLPEAAAASTVSFGEILETSDLPGGVVNLLTGQLSELLPHLTSHMDVNALYLALTDPADRVLAQTNAALNLKRLVMHNPSTPAPYRISDFTETKTTWHPVAY